MSHPVHARNQASSGLPNDGAIPRETRASLPQGRLRGRTEGICQVHGIGARTLASTVKSRIDRTGIFLRWFSRGHRKSPLSTISLNTVDRYFFAMAQTLGEGFAVHLCDNFESIFHLCESRRWCRTGIALGIKGPPIRQTSSVPGGPKWDQVLRLLRDANGRTPAAIRAKAILLLLCLYGLRRSEIIRLQFSDFDWENSVFHCSAIQTGGLQQFPLCREVSDSILRYIRSVRPSCTCESVFVSFHPPFGPIHRHR